MINPPITGNDDLDHFLYQVFLGNADSSASSTASSGTMSTDPVEGISYKYRYIHVKYADDTVGTNISNVPTDRIYWGVFNSSTTTESNNPANYTWFKTTGFGSSNYLYYSNLGGRIIKFFAGNPIPSGGKWLIDPGTAIDLDVLTIPITNINNGDSTVSGAAAMLNALTGSITESELYSTLGSRINLIDAASSVAGSVNARVAAEAAARVANINSVNSQIATIQADVATLSSTPDYSNTTTYSTGYVVKYSGSLYRARMTTVGHLPTDNTYWEKIGDYSSLSEAVAAQAVAITDLDTRTTANTTGLAAEVTARTLLASTVSTNNSTLTAAISSEASTRATADTANATNISTTAAFAATKSKTYKQSSMPTTDMTTGDLWFDTSNGNKAYRYTGTAWEVTDDTRIATTAAAVTTETSARIAADSAMASQITTLNSNVSTNAAAISTEASTRATADTALSNSINVLSSTVGGKNSTYRQSTQPTTNLVSGDLWFDTSDNNKAYRYNGTSWVATDDTRIATTAAAVVTEASTRATADTALSTSISSLTSTVNNNLTTTNAAIASEASTRATADTALSNSVTTLTSTVTNNDTAVRALISTEASTRASADTAMASTISTLQSTVNGNTAAISTEATTRATQTGDLYAKYTVKIDTNGYVSGYGLASTANNSTPTSSFIVRADNFSVASPSGPGITPIIPFAVTTTTQTVGSLTIPPGVYMDQASIKYINADKIDTRNLTIRDSSGTILFGAGTSLAAANITPAAAWLNSNISINSNGTLSGAGSGAVTVAGLDNSILRSSNPINTTNISTYIAAGAIGTAYIGNAAITNALIGNAAITTAKISDAAITTAKINDAAITTAKIGTAAITNAKIGTAEVGTLTIAGNAVTVPSGVTNYASTAISANPAGDGPSTLATLVVSSSGNPTIVNICTVYVPPIGLDPGLFTFTCEVNVFLKRNGTTLFQTLSSVSSSGGSCNFLIMDYPSSGTNTYTLVVQSNNYGYINGYNVASTITALEAKR